ncbi:teichoic acid D-Ala incorporation-associated protein DltX [Levilactobacillus brevis]|uniref:teichoic acid D-Ala incorporation-associated protein DltX n=1 Tax=Levilactobacillus brevis TaxID=1580 RepID=UPI00385152D9
MISSNWKGIFFMIKSDSLKQHLSGLTKYANTAKFIAKIVIYAAILVILVYLYDYSNIGGAHFIYNEF